MESIQLHTESMNIPVEPIKEELDQNINEDEIQCEIKHETQTEEILGNDNPFENVQMELKQEEISLTIEREVLDSQSDDDNETISDIYHPKNHQYAIPKSEAGCDEKPEVKEETVLGDSLVTYDYPNLSNEHDDAELDSSMDSNDAAALTKVETCLQDEVGIKNEGVMFEILSLKRLCDEDFEGFFNIPSGSEDEQDFSDAESDDDIEKIQSIQNFLSEPLRDVETSLSPQRHQCSFPVHKVTNMEKRRHEISDPQPSISGMTSETSTTTRTQSRATRRSSNMRNTIGHRSRITRFGTVTQRKKRRFIWKKTSFQCPPFTFIGNTNLQSPIIDFETPLQYFLWFFDDEFLQHIVEEIHKFSAQKNPLQPITITINELKKFIGVCVVMSLAPLPNIRMYWAPELGIRLIMETMSLNHFKKICQFLHFNDNSSQPPSGSPGYDRLHKIRPILETLKKKCQSIPKREALSVDVQMCATKASNLLRQYLPNKRHKWGYKLLVLCDDRGFAYDFEIYSGMETDPELRYPSEPDLGASSNTVVRLARSIPKNQNYKLFFDNYYTSPELIAYLAKEGIQSLGTVNKGRLGKDLKIPSIKDLKKDKIQRGYSEQWVANCDNTYIVTVMWYDNNPVVLSSSFVGQEPIETARRYCKKQKKYLQVDCPQIIKTYNQHKGGVDLLDSFLGKYKIKIRTRKWYLRLFYHLLDLTLINCWLLYRRVGEQQHTPTLMKQKDFKFEVGKSLCMFGLSINKKRDRPSLSDKIENKRQKLNTSILPPRDVRRDGFEHFPVWGTKRQRCKYPGCKGKTFLSCVKCRVELCLNKYKNCFRSFHQ